MEAKIFNTETGEIYFDTSVYMSAIRQLSNDLIASQGDYDESSLKEVMGAESVNYSGWTEFVQDMEKLKR